MVDVASLASRIWIGGLPEGITEWEVEQKFSSFGIVKWVRVRNGPTPTDTFAFVQYAKPEVAEAARSGMDQARISGSGIKGVIQVNMAKHEGKTAADFYTATPNCPKVLRLEPCRERNCSCSQSRSPERKRPRTLTPPPSSKSPTPVKRSAEAWVLRVKNLPPDMKQKELMGIGTAYGHVRRVEIWAAEKSDDGSDRGKVGLLEYRLREEAERALDDLDERRIDGWDMRMKADMPRAAASRR